MSRIKSRNTSIELFVRKKLYALGLRFRIKSNLPGHPDVVFLGKRVAVFIHGCFWHFHGCRLSTIPSTRTAVWTEKLRRNRQRDAEAAIELTEEGWKVITIWECDLKRNPAQEIAKVDKAVRKFAHKTSGKNNNNRADRDRGRA